MADEKLCKLCKADWALEVDLEKASYKSANNLLQRLFDCYNIDVSVLGESPFICKPCFEGVIKMSEQLQKWSNAQKVLQVTVCLPDNTMISVNEESEALWDENDDVEFPPEDSLELVPLSNSNDFEFTDEVEKTEDFDFLDEDEPQAEDVEFLDDEPQTEDVESFAEGPSTNRAEGVSAKVYEELFEIDQEKSTDLLNWRFIPHDFCCVCLRPDGLLLYVMFKDKTPQRNIRILCTCCNKVFASVPDIQKHSWMTRYHPEYWCRLCGIHFPSITDLKFHEEYKNHHLANSNLIIRCLTCDKISAHFSNAIKHQNTYHNKVSFDCKKCSMSFASSISLENHEWKHKNHVCPRCQQKFKQWDQYLKHMKLHKRIASHSPVPSSTSVLMPGEHVKHLRTQK